MIRTNGDAGLGHLGGNRAPEQVALALLTTFGFELARLLTSLDAFRSDRTPKVPSQPC